MAFEPFGLVGGLGVGIPSILVIDENGNFVANVLTTGNVSANVISANTFKFANGANLTTSAAGSNTEVQFNNDSEFGADPTFTFDSTQSLLTVSNLAVSTFTSLGDISNVSILGGIDGYFLQTDGAGNLTWAAGGNGGGGNGSPGGSNTEVQYNKAGTFGGDAGFTYNDVTNTLHSENISATTVTATLVGNATRAGSVTTNAQPNITSVGTLVSLRIDGNTYAPNFVGNLVGVADTALTVTNNAQPNITSVGTLVSLDVTGDVTASNFVGNLSGTADTALTVTNNAQPNITSVGTLTNLAFIGNITGGNLVSANYFAGTLTTASQPNITSVGTLTGLGVNGTLTAVNITSNTGIFAGNATGLHHIPGANVTGVVANANYASWSNSANTSITVTRGAQPNITSVGKLVALEVLGNIYVDTNSFLGNLAEANYFSGDGGFLSNLQVGNANVGNANYATFSGHANTANTVVNNAQPNITSVGTLVSLDVTGTANISGNVTLAPTSTLRTRGNINFASSPNVFFGSNANLHITGGFADYVLTTDGTGNLSWTSGGSIGGSPGGPNTAVQFNANGDFGGSGSFLFNTDTNVASLNGDFVANSVQIGFDVYKFATTKVEFATTASTGSGQVIYQVPVANLAGAEFHIIGTDPSGPSRQSIKLTAVYYNGTVQYSEYAGLYINGGVGNFDVEYYPGGGPTPPSLRLTVAPNTSNIVSYKIMVTLFSE